MISHAYRTALIASTWLALSTSSCRDRSSVTEHRSAPTPSATASSNAGGPRTRVMSPSASAERGTAPVVSSSASAKPSGSAGVPAATNVLGPDVAFAMGAVGLVVRTKADELVVAPWKDGVLQPFVVNEADVARSPVALVDGPPSRAYWVSGERVVRREVRADGTTGDLEVLVNDAAPNTEVVASKAKGPMTQDVVLYIGREVSREMERAAQLWVEGHGSRRLSREAGGATSISVVNLGGGKFALLTLDGRVGMSPVHAIFLELDANGAPHLGEDRVVYVAGPAERRTRLVGVQLGLGPVALVPIARATTQFGLLTLVIGHGEGEAPASWIDYPNGLDPAPLVASLACRTSRIAFVRPTGKLPKEGETLEIARVSPKGEVADRKTIADAAKIRHLAMFAGNADGNPGTWVAYGTEQGLHAAHIPCE